MAHVLLEQAQCDRLECLRHRGDLGEDVDAVLLVLDHALQTAGLALDTAQPLEVVVLAVDVAVLLVVGTWSWAPWSWALAALPCSTVSMAVPPAGRAARGTRGTVPP